ncbi:MAG: alpha/beta hydrolase [Gemmatimonadetes bacterium]|nr:alpha/beta hydrolase [Gemmatimonadota bacterium]MYA42534.1 alpha/beta hydrolase [Gemmatimonadota bacterium]MYE94399.1 alpha/beta hydrolase [Gemmatimonadota bacterium]MYJ10182.1 alpha/beta hydrolase [Gemmatimonadota bacterium]
MARSANLPVASLFLMNRRDFIRTSATFAAGTALANCRTADEHLIHFELHGPEDGVPLFLGFPLMASYAEIFGEEQAAVKNGFLNRLTDRYRVLLVDYPNVGRTMVPAPAEMTPDRVYSDLLSVADAAGFDRFAYCGHLWGAINGLMLASRSDRVSALICGTWPPLGAPYADMLRGGEMQLAEPPPHAMVILRNPEQYAQWHTFYSGMQDWPEAEVAAAITCPRIALIGANAESSVAGIPLRLVERVREARPALEAMGWTVREIPGAETAAILDPAVMVPEIRSWLDQV